MMWGARATTLRKLVLRSTSGAWTAVRKGCHHNREDQHKTLTDRISLKFYLQRKNSQTDFWEEVFYLFTSINTELITRNYAYNLKRLKEKVFPKI